MKRKEKKEWERFRDVRIGGAFLIFGTLFAFSVGMTVNALYDLMKISNRWWSDPLAIFLVFAILSVVLLHFVDFMVENVHDLVKQDDSTVYKRYAKRFGRDAGKLLKFLFTKGLKWCTLLVALSFGWALVYVIFRDLVFV
jgi:hypothetical protein